MVDAGDVGGAGCDAGGQDDVVVVLGGEFVGVNRFAGAHVDSGTGEPDPVVADGVVEFGFAGDEFGHVPLAAEFVGGVVEGDRVAAFGGGERERHAGGSSADDPDPPAGG